NPESCYGYARSFSEGLALVASSKNNIIKGQYIDKTGKVVIEQKLVNPIYDDPKDHFGDFNGGLAHVRIGKKWCYIDKTGKIVWEESKSSVVDRTNKSLQVFKRFYTKAELHVRKDGMLDVSGYQARIKNLQSVLEKILSIASDKKLYLKFDSELEWGNFVDIAEIIKAAGIEEIAIIEMYPFVLEKALGVRVAETTTGDISVAPPVKLVAPLEIPEDILGPIFLTLHRDGKVDLNRRFYEYNRVQKELAYIYSSRQDKTIFIRADAIMPFGKVVELIDLAREAGVKTIGFCPEYFTEDWENIEKETEAGKHEEETKEVWVMPRIIGELGEDFYIIKKEVFPPKVEIKGPASKIKNICLVETTPIDISSWTKYGEVEADIILHDPHIELS
ncbi:biopolymer transporter ExbD, partial [bacterium]|nr:biopolymer transporter ExbD [bacterium]